MHALPEKKFPKGDERTVDWSQHFPDLTTMNFFFF